MERSVIGGRRPAVPAKAGISIGKPAPGLRARAERSIQATTGRHGPSPEAGRSAILRPRDSGVGVSGALSPDPEARMNEPSKVDPLPEIQPAPGGIAARARAAAAPPYLAGLNAEQRAAVEKLDCALLVTAGDGTCTTCV